MRIISLGVFNFNKAWYWGSRFPDAYRIRLKHITIHHTLKNLLL
ncbi:protein of unknown function [Tepidibacter aestuarii]|nr:protein of unknown function [Tepidibacter aestuarii]